MVMTAQIEESEQPQKEPAVIEVPAPSPYIIDGQELLEAFTPAEVPTSELSTIKRNNTPEIQLSQLGGGESYDELKTIIRNRDQDLRTQVAQAISTLPIAKPGTIADVLKKIGKAKIPDRTIGGYAAEAILKSHPPANKRQLADDLDVAEGKNIISNSVKDNLGFKGSYDEGMNEPNETATSALVIVTPGGKVEKESSFNDVLEYINPLFGEDPAGMDIEVWEAFKGIITGTFDSEAFDTQMTSNYGEEWVGRFAAFAAKEVAIDGMLLILASTVVGAPLAATLFGAKNALRASKVLKYSQTGFRANAQSIAARSVIFGIGGGSAQSYQNYLLDRDLNFGMEVAFRMGGSALFEGIAVGARTGFKALKGRDLAEMSENAAKGSGVKSFSRKKINTVLDGEQYAVGPYAAITREHLFSKIDGYEKVSGETSINLIKLEEASETVIDGLSAFLGVDRFALKNVQVSAIMDDLIRFKGRIDKAGDKAILNQTKNSEGLVPHLLSTIRGEYIEGDRIAQMYMDGGTLQFRANELNINSSNISAVNTVLKGLHLAEPDRVAGSIGADFLDVHGFENKLANGFVGMYDDALGKQKIFSKATSKFSEKEIRVINNLLEEGDTANRIYDFENVFPENVVPERLTPEIQKAYIQTRMIMDLAYELKNTSLTNNLKGVIDDPKTGKLFKIDDDFVEITKRLQNNKFEGRVYNRDKLSSAGGEVIHNITKANLKEIDSVIPFRNGHIPRGYREHKYSILFLDGNAGKVSREALFDNRVEAELAFRRYNEIKGEGQSVALVSNKADSSLTGAMFTRNSINVLDAVGSEQKAVLSKQLKDMGLDSESVMFMFKDRPGAGRGVKGGAKGRTELGTATTEKGKELRLEHAKITARIANLNVKIRLAKKAKTSTTQLKKSVKAAEALAGRKRAEIIKRIPKETAPTQDSIVEYLGMVAHQAGHDIWQRVGIDHFNSKYSKFLVPEGTWLNASDKTGKFFVNQGKNIPTNAMRSEIKGFSRFLRRNITNRTHLEKMWDNAILSQIDAFGRAAADGNIVATSTRKLWDNAPLARDLINFLRYATAFPKLLFYPFIQMYIQGSQAIATVSVTAAKDIVGLTQALSQFPRVTAIHARLRYGQRIPRHIRNSDSYKAYDELIRSGYNADLSTSDTLWSTRNTLNAGPLGKMIKELNRGGALPFRGGEAINRTTAFLVVRKQLMRQIDTYERALKKGGLSEKQLAKVEGKAGRGANGEILRVGDIGSASYLKAIVNISKVMAFNMGKAGELEAFSGFGSILFQFKQVGIKQIAMFDSSLLSTRQKIAGAAGLLGAFGSGAIPFFPDVFKATDAVLFQATGNDPTKIRLASDFAALSVETFSDLMGTDKKFTERLFSKGILTAATAGEVDIASRIALGHIWSDTFNVQNWYDLVPMTAVAADYVEFARQLALRDINANILNVYSWAELVAQMSAGKSFKEALLKQYDPQSTIGKFIIGEASIGATSLEFLREIGTVFSQAGSMSRALDAANMYTVHPDLIAVHPDVTPRYSTSSGRIVDVEATFGRDLQFFTGLTPGLYTETFDKKNLEFRYKSALNDARDKLIEDLRRADEGSGPRAIRAYGNMMRKLRDIAKKLDLDFEVIADGEGQARMMYMNILINYGAGKDLR